MAADAATVAGNVRQVRERILRAGGTGVTLVAVTKTHPFESMQAAMNAGCDALGENYVQEIVETSVGGSQATELLDGPRRFPVMVRFPDSVRSDATAIGNVLLTGRRGERVPLWRVATIAETQAPEAINHENAERRLVVQTNVRGRDVGSFVAEARGRVERALTLPPGYHIAWGGQFENQARATARLAVVVPLSVAII